MAGQPAIADDVVVMKRGCGVITGLFAANTLAAVCFHNLLDLPTFLNMITGLAYRQFYGQDLARTQVPQAADSTAYGQVGVSARQGPVQSLS